MVKASRRDFLKTIPVGPLLINSVLHSSAESPKAVENKLELKEQGEHPKIQTTENLGIVIPEKEKFDVYIKNFDMIAEEMLKKYKRILDIKSKIFTPAENASPINQLYNYFNIYQISRKEIINLEVMINSIPNQINERSILITKLEAEKNKLNEIKHQLIDLIPLDIIQLVEFKYAQETQRAWEKELVTKGEKLYKKLPTISPDDFSHKEGNHTLKDFCQITTAHVATKYQQIPNNNRLCCFYLKGGEASLRLVGPLGMAKDDYDANKYPEIKVGQIFTLPPGEAQLDPYRMSYIENTQYLPGSKEHIEMVEEKIFDVYRANVAKLNKIKNNILSSAIFWLKNKNVLNNIDEETLINHQTPFNKKIELVKKFGVVVTSKIDKILSESESYSALVAQIGELGKLDLEFDEEAKEANSGVPADSNNISFNRVVKTVPDSTEIVMPGLNKNLEPIKRNQIKKTLEQKTSQFNQLIAEVREDINKAEGDLVENPIIMGLKQHKKYGMLDLFTSEQINNVRQAAQELQYLKLNNGHRIPESTFNYITALKEHMASKGYYLYITETDKNPHESEGHFTGGYFDMGCVAARKYKVIYRDKNKRDKQVEVMVMLQLDTQQTEQVFKLISRFAKRRGQSKVVQEPLWRGTFTDGFHFHVPTDCHDPRHFMNNLTNSEAWIKMYGRDRNGNPQKPTPWLIRRFYKENPTILANHAR